MQESCSTMAVNVDEKETSSQPLVVEFSETLLEGRSLFPFFMVVASETGCILRSLILLLSLPYAWLLSKLVSEEAAIKLLIFVTFAGLKLRNVVCVCRAVLPKFFAENLHSQSSRAFLAFEQRYVVTAMPRIMLEVFAKDYLGVKDVIGTELEVTKGGRATGFVSNPGVLLGKTKSHVLQQKFRNVKVYICLNRSSLLSKRMLSMSKCNVVDCCGLKQPKLLKPLVFHAGRLVNLPTPFRALAIVAWLPFGFTLCAIRLFVAMFFVDVDSKTKYITRLFGFNVIVKGTPPTDSPDGSGVLFVCSHRSMLDSIAVSVAIGKSVTALTHSPSAAAIDRFSPINTTRLFRNRERDIEKVQKLLQGGNLLLCPEGTTCREPFLLRFSPLFAELTDKIVPVAINVKTSMFYGTSTGRWKLLDPIFFFMNPFPVYEITFLPQLPRELTMAGGKSSTEVASFVQHLIADTLGFECTGVTRKDKYQVLTGHDGNRRVERNSKCEHDSTQTRSP